MDWLLQYPITHRGLHKDFDIPENSLLAFKEAILNSYAIELDVRVTKDKKIVVFHDKNLLRVCAIKKEISDIDYKDLEKLYLYKTKEKIPLLNEVLKLVKGRVPLLIEIKSYNKVGEFERILVKELKLYKGDFAICSFNSNVIKWFKKSMPSFKRGLIFGDLKRFQMKFYRILFLYKYFKSKPDFISLDYRLLDTTIPYICKYLKKPIICWTINSKKRLEKAEKTIDNIIFENIDLKEKR